jgi:hypothetical protein
MSSEIKQSIKAFLQTGYKTIALLDSCVLELQTQMQHCNQARLVLHNLYCF